MALATIVLPAAGVAGIGFRLRSSRLALEMSGLEVAERSGTSQSTVSRLERSATGVKLEAVLAIAATVQVNPMWLIFGEGNP